MSEFPIQAPQVDELLTPLRCTVSDIAATAVSLSQPLFVHLLGPPGAGKSTIASLLGSSLRDVGPTTVAFDKIMESVPEYQNTSDRKKAFGDWELPARAAGYTLLRILTKARAPIILDHSGAFPEHVQLLKYARRTLGYTVAVVRVRATPETAARRMAIRRSHNGRFVPAHYINERLAVIERLVSEYQQVAHYYGEISNEEEGPDGLAEVTTNCDRIGLILKDRTNFA